MTPPVTAKMARPAISEIEDVQGRADTRRLPINRVGIKDISHPVRVRDRSAGEQHTIATFNMYVSLPHNFKGTHMSRFVEILHTEREISVESFRAMLGTMTERLEADVGHVEMTFPFFVMKKAPVSGVESLMNYQASLIGERRDGRTEKYVTERAYDNPKFVEDVVRDVATRLNADDRVAAYAVESENFESIHNHSAY